MGFNAAIMQLSADLDYDCNYLELRHFNSANNPCFKCNANRSTIPWTDCRPDAQCQNHLVTALDWFLIEKHMVFQGDP